MSQYCISSTSELPDRLVGEVSVDLETHDPGLKSSGPGWCFSPPEGFVIGIAVTADNFSKYIPIAHDTPGNVETDPVVRWFREVVQNGTQSQIYANAQYDYGWLRTLGINMTAAPDDVLVQAPVLDEHAYSYDLDALIKKFLPNMGGKKNDELEAEAAKLGIKPNQVKANLKRLPVEIVGEYAVYDVVLTKALFQRLKPDIEQADLLSTYELERNLIPMLVEMRAKGVPVDTKRAAQTSERYLAKETQYVQLIKDKTGITLEKYFSAAQLAQVFDYYQIPYPRTEKRKQPQIDAALLKEFAGANECVQAILDLRRYNKARTTFLEGFIIDSSHNGRLHGSFNPLKSDEGGTISGRFSSSNPNLQQIPARDPEIGPDVRACFVPEDGCAWGSLDYSQQEPRHCVSMAYRAGFPSAAAMRRRFIDDPTTDFHDENTRLTGLDVAYGWESGRKKAKNVGLGLMYSMGGAKLCWQLGLPTKFEMRYGRMVEVPGDEGQKILDMFHNGAPYIRQLSKMCVAAAKSRGWIRTPMGRKFRFPYRDGQHYKSHKALNSLIQGMSADEMKNAMVLIYREGFLPSLTVHDEIDFTNIEDPQDFRRPVEIMLESMNMPVPSRVDLEVGPNWGEIKKYELADLPIIYSEA